MKVKIVPASQLWNERNVRAVAAANKKRRINAVKNVMKSGAVLGFDQVGEMCVKIQEIAVRENEAITHDGVPYYEEDKIIQNLLGNRGYQGRMVMDDNGWKEEVL